MISVALTKEELEKLNIVKKWFDVTYRDMLINVIVKLMWGDVPKKYRKKFDEKQKEQKKGVRKKFRAVKTKKKKTHR